MDVKTQVKETTEKVEKVAGDVKTQVVDTAKVAVDSPVVKTAHSGLLVGLGAVVVGKEEVEGMMDRLVEKGEVAAKDLYKMWHDLFSQRKEDMTKVEEKLEGVIDQRITAMLGRMNIPTKTDLEGLTAKVGDLTAKVAEMDKKLNVKKAA